MKALLLPCIALIALGGLCLDTLAMDSEKATRVIKAAYQDLLDREPDESGLRAWRKKLVDEGWTEEQLRAALKKSPEYKGLATDAIIEAAYQDLLNRKPDKEGRKFLTEKIEREGWGEKRVREWIRKSDEFKQKRK